MNDEEHKTKIIKIYLKLQYQGRQIHVIKAMYIYLLKEL